MQNRPAVLFLALFLALISWLGASGCALAAEPRVIAYYFPRAGENFGPEQLQAKLLTHINYAFADIRDGEVVLGNPDLDRDHLARLRALKQRYPHLHTLVSVGGWTWSKEFSNVAASADARARFAASAVRYMREQGMDGVDIDWEFPVEGGEAHNARRAEDKHNFTLLLQALRTALDAAGKSDGRPYLLTAALGNNATYIRNTEMAEVIRLLDWANLMSYDFSGPWDTYASHNAPLYDDPAHRRAGASAQFNIDSVVGMFAKAGVPLEKLVLGVPFYGYTWQGCRAAQDGQWQDCSGKGIGTREPGAVSAEHARQLAQTPGYVRHWNAAAQVPFLFHAARGEFITYDDAESLRLKVAFLRRKGMGGVMFWEASGDADGSLQKVLHEALSRP